MKYCSIDSSLFVHNRANFVASMRPGALAVFFSHALPHRSADTYFTYRQQSDLFYLSGIDQEDTVLVLYPDAPEDRYKEILFVKKTNKHIAIREGNKLTTEQAKDISGVQNIQYVDSFDKVFHFLSTFCQGIYANLNENMRGEPVWDKNRVMVQKLQSRYPLHQFFRSGPILRQLRMVKSSGEIDLIQKACDITAKAFDRVLQTLQPGMMEYQVEAEITREFLWHGATGHAYTPIVASGKNACVLHYIDNDAQCLDGDLLLMDFGCEYANYASDCTRTIPVNGMFTQRQSDVYDAVLHVQQKAMQLLVPGKNITMYHKEVGEIMTEQLLQLGLITDQEIKEQGDVPAYKKYFMHGTSHHLGLDVHDHGDFYVPIAPGMVFTVEPGIYIPEENIGIRLENDVVITADGYVDLMKDIPIHRADIQERMQQQE